jgi:Cu+-exporting ATPase
MAVTPPSLYAKKVQGAHTILEENTQHIVIDVKSGGYSPNYIKVKQGVPVEITLKSTGSVSCANAFVLPKFHISEQLGPNDSKVISFVPEDVGKFSFSCAMGMYTGVIEVERG